MQLSILPIVPVRGCDGLVMYYDKLITLTIEPRWKRVEGIGIRLSFQDYTLSLKWPLFFKFQLHVAKYDVGDRLEEHKDVVAFGHMWRIQFILRNATQGGELRSERFLVNKSCFKIFEPGKYKHEVTEIKEGRRLVLNFGIWIAKRPNLRKKIQEDDSTRALGN